MDLETLVATATVEQAKALELAVIEELWYQGDLSYLLRPDGQTRVYEFTKDWKRENQDSVLPIIWNCHRRMGKSFCLILKCIERCLQYPGQEVRFGAPTSKMAKEIVEPLIQQVLSDCPEALKPIRRQNNWSFRNPRWEGKARPSTLHLVGCKEGADTQRGLASDMVVLDECREIDKFEYVVGSIFGFHFAGRENPLMILASTPPDTMDHAWVAKYLEEGRREDRYIEVRADQNTDFTERDRKILLPLCGGSEETTTWQREALCQLITDEKSLVIPEFRIVKESVAVDHYERPEFFFPHECMDFGFVDYTACLFGYVDFKKQLLIIDDEYVVHYKSLGDIARGIKDKETALYPGTLLYPVRRFGDNEQLALQTLSRDYGLYVSAADKWNAEAAIADLRTKFQEGKIRIHKRCKELLYQLANGIKDEKGKIVRTEKCGHCDAIMALVYLNRMVNWSQNPYPFKQFFDPNLFQGPKPRIATPRGNLKVTRINIVRR